MLVLLEASWCSFNPKKLALSMMEVFKNLLEPDCEESEFNELIQMIKTAKEAIENLNKSIEYDDDY